MSIVQSKTFEADPDKVWVAVIRIAKGAGYTIRETNARAKQLVYQASGGVLAWSQLVTVSVSGVEEHETIVSVRAEAKWHGTLLEGGQQRRLIAFFFDKLEEVLKEKPPLSADQKQFANAPGTSGCFGMVMLLVTVAVITYTVVTFVISH